MSGNPPGFPLPFLHPPPRPAPFVIPAPLCHSGPLRHSGASRNPEDTFPPDPGFRRGDEGRPRGASLRKRVSILRILAFAGMTTGCDLQVCNSPSILRRGSASLPCGPPRQFRTKGGKPPLEPPERKEVRIHGVKLRATRNPTKSTRFPVGYLPRLADRRILGSLKRPQLNTERVRLLPEMKLLLMLPINTLLLQLLKRKTPWYHTTWPW